MARSQLAALFCLVVRAVLAGPVQEFLVLLP